jgi:ElaB/YqjD/DUF883 family membrane-anchored ribosome-binding protein
MVAVALIGDQPGMQLAGARPLVKRKRKTMATAKTPADAAKPAPKRAPAKKPAAKPAAAKVTAAAAAPSPSLTDQAKDALNQAQAKARKAADTGKATAAGAMTDMAAMVEDVAKTIDDRIGVQYGDYARKAASAVSGVAEGLQSKEVEQLMDDAREFVRKRPAVAIGAAAAVGFLLTRLIKADDSDEA